MSAPPRRIEICEAAGDRVTEAVGVFEAAMLDVDVTRARAVAGDADGTVLVAVDADAPPSGGVVLGALLLDGREITAIAVRPRRRGQGIGSALVRAASARADGPLVAFFEAGLRPFYDRLGFAIERAAEGRYRGRLDTA